MFHTKSLLRLASGLCRRLSIRHKSNIIIPLSDEIDRYAQFHPTILSLQNFIDFSSENDSNAVKKSFLFLSKELLVRLANIMKEIHLLPEQLLCTPSVKQVEGWYRQSFEDMLKYQYSNADSEQTLRRFNETLDIIRNRHSTVVETMASGVLEMKDELQHAGLMADRIPMNIDNCIQYFLDRFYMSRISIRMIIHQHLLMFAKSNRNRRHVELIDLHCDIVSVIEDAYDNARFLCEQYYSNAPSCEIECRDPFTKPHFENQRLTITYVPSHLHHIVFELMKNSLRAVVENSCGNELPKIKVLVCKGRKDLTIKISDLGGGIPRSELDLLFNYMYSTAPRPPAPDAVDSTPLAGYGYGLPLSRLYAKYFNGDLWLTSVDGYGTDAMICLKLLPRDANELLPVFNKTSISRYMQSAQIGDWSDKSQSFNGTSRFNSTARRSQM